jgi:hypothetical protein
MYMRLGFAVAVHLDPEIVLIDEAFAVGDAHFQRKCLHTIRDFQRGGRTIVLVSHDLHLVEQLCSHVALLQQGRLVAAGAAADVIGRYHELDMGRGLPGMSHRWGTGTVQITSVDLLRDGAPAAGLRTRDALTIRLHYRCDAPVERPVFGVAIHRDDGTHVTGPNTRTSGFPVDRLEGSGAVDYAIDHLPLLPGRYLVSAAVYDEDLITALDHRERLMPFVVVEGGTAERLGVIELDAAWRRADAGREVS